MEHDFRGLFTSLDGLIEYLFIIGLHKEALDLIELSKNKTLAQKLDKKYNINYCDFHSEMDESQIKPDYCLLSQEEYEFLHFSASKLRPGSKILEIGTYLGGSTSALCKGSSENNCEVTTIDAFQGFKQKNNNLTLHQPMNWEI